ncbi:10152_t:CDS:1, partial [Diversispora eburnea]
MKKREIFNYFVLLSSVITFLCFFIWVTPSDYLYIYNRPFGFYKKTLGFDHIYCINLPSRSDRRGKIDIIAKFHDLDIDFVKAISSKDTETLDRYLTYGVAPQHKACYVSHYKTYELIVSNNYQSALILEDDVDFEVNIKDFLNEIQPFLPINWDMFYLGNCAWDTSNTIYYNGKNYGSDLLLSKSNRPACSHAYAVSLRGARKLLENLVNITKPVDVALIDLILANKIFSLSLLPSIINQWKSKDDPSDISPGAQDEPHNLKNSTLELFGYRR